VTDEASAPVVQGLLDTSVVIALEQVSAGALPLEAAIAAVTLAELAAGPTRPTTPRNGHVGRIGS
jgi:predicted nucleic acid-binding protein